MQAKITKVVPIRDSEDCAVHFSFQDEEGNSYDGVIQTDDADSVSRLIANEAARVKEKANKEANLVSLEGQTVNLPEKKTGKRR